MKSSKRRGAAPRKLAVATPAAVASNSSRPDALGGSLENYQHLFAALALSILTLLAYGNSFDGGFVLDNRGLLLNDPRLRQATAANLSLIWRHTYWWPTGACPMVHSHLCAAAAGTIGTLEGTDQMQLAQARKKMFVDEFGCFVQ